LGSVIPPGGDKSRKPADKGFSNGLFETYFHDCYNCQNSLMKIKPAGISIDAF